MKRRKIQVRRCGDFICFSLGCKICPFYSGCMQILHQIQLKNRQTDTVVIETAVPNFTK